ncbi:MAG TPA: serine hydrolase [Anaerolineales bacterium]|nr:serine hydrolase [Anaerolineales bacterium]
MKKRKLLFWILSGVILIVGLFVVGLGILGRLPWQSGDLYEDPRGRFTMEIDPSWEKVETDGSYAQFKLPDPPVNLYMLVLDANTINDAFSQAMGVVGFDPGLLSGNSVTTFGDWHAYQQDDSAGLTYALAGQIVSDKAYVMIVKTDRPGVSVESAALLGALYSIKISGKEEIVFESYADVEALVLKEVDRLTGSSLSIALFHQGEIVYTYVYGVANPAAGIPADAQTIYQYGSMTKVVTATAVMQLVEQGKVDLDAWPGEYIPEFPEQWNVTVRQLLDHAACMPYGDRLTDGLIVYPGESFPPMEEIFTAYVKDYPDLVCKPGKASAYNNPPFLALARIIEEVSGEPYDTYVVNHLLTPLGMESTSFQFVEAEERYAKDLYPAAKVDDFIAQLNDYRGPGQEKVVLQRGEPFVTLVDYQILPPWGGLRGTPSDAVHFLQMHLSGGRYGDHQILQPETVAAMQQNQSALDGSPLGFGLSWWIGKDGFGDFYYHVGNGAGSESTMRIYPNLDLGVVVMSNSKGYQRDQIVKGLVSAWMNEK